MGGSRIIQALHAPPRISVILPTFKRQQLLPRAISSVLGQTRTDWELLVIDDEPSAETKRIVSSFSDERVRYLAHGQNRGLSAARNTGLRSARGDYIAFLDDDDAFLENKLERQAAVLEGAPEQLAIVSCFEEIRRADGSTTTRSVRLDGDVHWALLKNDLVRMQLLLVRRICFDRIGMFDERLPHHEDFDMSLRLSRSFHFVTIPEPLVSIIETQGSLSTNVGNRVRALETIMSTHPEFRDYRRVRARWQRRLARHHGEMGNRTEWRRTLLQSLRTDPTSVSTWTTLSVGSIFGPAAHFGLAKLRGRMARVTRAANAQ